jgi:hypothetical protein
VTLSLAWKDLREQQGLIVAIVGLGMACMVVLTAGLVDDRLLRDVLFWERMTRMDAARNMALAFAWTGGLIAGAIALAGEREAGTMPFLDALTRLRRPVWRAKCAFGAVTSLVETLILLAAAWAYGVLGDARGPWAFGSIFVAATLYSFAWGMLGSAYARTVLGACGLAIVGQVAGGVVVTLIYGMLTALLDAKGEADTLVEAFSFLVVAGVPLKASAARFCRSDADRQRAVRPSSTSARAVVQPTPWRAVFWLTWRQAAGWAATAVGLAVVAVLLRPYDWTLLWPSLTGLLGLVAGIGVFAGEQGTGTARFLGDRRLPAGPLWRTKIGSWFGLAAIPSAIVLLFGLGAVTLFGPWKTGSTQDDSAQSRLLSQMLFGGLQQIGDANAAGSVALASAAAAYLSVWLLYGFAVGQFAALMLRKAVIAGVVGLVITATALGLWLPSLAVGGLHPWQWLGPPVILLVASRLAMRTWVSERLGEVRATAGLTAGALAAVAWQAGALWYRPIEVVGLAEPFNVRAYLVSFPSPEENAAQNLLTRAASDYRQREEVWRVEGLFGGAQGGGAPPEGMPGDAAGAAPVAAGVPGDAPAPPGGATEPVGPQRPPLWERLNDVVSRGWPSDDAELARWLDREFAADNKWVGDLRAAVGHPPGALYDVRSVAFATPVQAIQNCRGMANLLCMRALQLKARDDAAGALNHIRLTLALGRHLRSKSFPIQFLAALAIEDAALRTLERWADRLGQNPELLAQALQMLREHEAAAAPLTEALKGEYLVVRNAIQDPSQTAQIVDEVPQQRLYDRDVQFRRAAREAGNALPWEAERTSRLLAVLFAGYLHAAELPYARLVEQLSPLPESMNPRAMSPEDQLLDGWLAPTPELSTPAARSRLAGQLASTWWASRLITRQSGLLGADLRARTNLRAAQLQIAFALYEQREGKPAPSLDALVPSVLPAVLTDPYGGGPFHYRAAESGKSGVVWSVGPDLVDQGGRSPLNDPTRYGTTIPAGDLIYPVPRTKK